MDSSLEVYSKVIGSSSFRVMNNYIYNYKKERESEVKKEHRLGLRREEGNNDTLPIPLFYFIKRKIEYGI